MVVTNSYHDTGVVGFIGYLSAKDVIFIYNRSVLRPFLLLGHGNPSSDYTGYDGAVRFRQNIIFENHRWHGSATSDYENTEIDSWLNDDESGYLSGFPGEVRSLLVAGRMPFRPGNEGAAVAVGASGLLRKVHLPTHTELGFAANANLPTMGVDFGLFPTFADRQIRNAANIPFAYQLRVPNLNGTQHAHIGGAGSLVAATVSTAASVGVAPMIALPETAQYVEVNGQKILRSG